jgi:predicted nucleic acid-binding Zn ribbon protein
MSKRGKRPCFRCGQGFVPIRPDHEFCSTACRVASWRVDQKVKRAKLPRRPKAPSGACCEHCGDLIPAGARADARYCSGACRVAAHRAQKREEQRASSPDLVN